MRTAPSACGEAVGSALPPCVASKRFRSRTLDARSGLLAVVPARGVQAVAPLGKTGVAICVDDKTLASLTRWVDTGLAAADVRRGLS
jgi:hypothetical protein